MKAQAAMKKLMDMYLYSGRKLLPHVLPCLKGGEEISHEQFKVSTSSSVVWSPI